MRYPNSPFMVLYNAYRIVRQGEPAGDGLPRDAHYFVQRPDGSECGRDLKWAETEPLILRDMAASGWPADSMPPEPAEAISSGRRTDSTPTPAAKPKRARARSAPRSR